MFTGLVEGIGRVVRVAPASGGVTVDLDLGSLAQGLRIGDSVAVSGCCLTVVGLDGSVGRFDLSEESLQRTWFRDLTPGVRLNLERSLRAGQPMGGHLVQGHVDGVGRVLDPVDPAQGGDWWVRIPRDLLAYCVVKGSIALDGVSLTIAEVRDDRLRIAIIPHTASATTIGAMPAGHPLNVEVDVLAKYVERILAARLEGLQVRA
ncbi:MAG: riboflavin synthase [Planctomycetes bacterium]|nr:riboflavin synthase [Planctomycetota bacterium]